MRVLEQVGLALIVGGALVACSGGDGPPDSPPAVSASPRGGVFANDVEVTLACTDDSGACDAVFVTTDASEPSPTSARYAGPLTIGATTTLRFSGRDRAGQMSPIAEEEYVVDAEAPIVSALPAGGAFASSPTVLLVCSDGAGSGCAEIRYTLDGTTPNEDSPTYAAPIVAIDGTDIRFVALDAAGNASAEGRETYQVDASSPVTTPTPGPGFFGQAIDVALSCDDPGGSGCAVIHYTLDDTIPTVLSPEYDTPLHLTTTTRLRAAAVDAVGNVEPVHVWEYRRDDASPRTTPAPLAGAYRPPINVTLACSDGESGCDGIYYTLDGTSPGPASTRYQQPIPLLTTTTVRFASVDAVGNAEPAGEAVYVLDGDAPTASATPPGGTYGPSLTVLLTCDDGSGSGCAGIRFTLDGSVPTASSPPYAGPIAIAESATLRFRATDAAGNVTVGAQTYAVDAVAPRLASTAPHEGAGAVEPGALIQLTFDEALVAEGLAASVNGVSAMAALDGTSRVVTVTPSTPLALDAAWTVALSGVRDAFGNAPAEPVELSFRTRGDVLPLSGAGSATITPQGLAYDSAGNAVAVYNANTGKLRKTVFTRFDAASGTWAPEVELYREALTAADGWPNPVRSAGVASNGSGFLVAWSTGAPTAKARFIDAAGVLGPELPLFGTAHLQGVASNGAGYVVVVMTPSGFAARAWNGGMWSLEETFAPQGYGFKLVRDGNGYLAAYRQSVTNQGSSVLVAGSTDGTGWGASVVYSTTYAVTDPAIASGPNGVRAVAFTVSGAVGAVFASVGSGGFLPAAAMIANGDQPTSASVAVSSEGVAVVWQARADGGAATYARIHAAGTWGATETLATSEGMPRGVTVASDGSGFLAIAQVAAGPILRAYSGGTWGDGVPAQPAGAPAGAPLVLERAAGYVLAFAQDDGTRHQLRLRSHSGAQGEAGLGAMSNVATAQPGSARELRLAADGSGGSIAVWTQEHRGGPTVFAAFGRNGSYDAAFVVAVGADSPAVASNGTGFVIVYRRGTSCDSVALKEGGVAVPATLEDGATGACTRPRIASDGVRYVAGWRKKVSYEETIRAAVGDGVTWSVPATLHATGSYDAELDVAAHGGVFGVAFDASDLNAEVVFRSSDDGGATFGPSQVVNDWSPREGPRVAAGAGGFAVLWANYNRVYGSVSSAGVFPWRPTEVRLDQYSCSSAAIVAGPDGFLAGFDCYAPLVVEWASGWKPATALASTPADGIRLAASPRGYAVLYRERTSAANLRGGTRVGGVWRLETVRPRIEAGTALVWDGEAHVVAWTEVGAVDLGADSVLARRGL